MTAEEILDALEAETAKLAKADLKAAAEACAERGRLIGLLAAKQNFDAAAVSRMERILASGEAARLRLTEERDRLRAERAALDRSDRWRAALTQFAGRDRQP